MGKRIIESDYIGKKYNMFTILSFGKTVYRKLPPTSRQKTASYRYVIAKCDCGKSIEIIFNAVVSGRSKSCGCFRSNVKYWGVDKSLYKIYEYIVRRCYNPKDKNYHNYGGRGIVMCDRWKRSYADFLSDVGLRPSKKHSLDRINNDGNYEPSNVRWATQKEQLNNTRTSNKFTAPKVAKLTGFTHSRIALLKREGRLDRFITEIVCGRTVYSPEVVSYLKNGGHLIRKMRVDCQHIYGQAALE